MRRSTRASAVEKTVCGPDVSKLFTSGWLRCPGPPRRLVARRALPLGQIRTYNGVDPIRVGKLFAATYIYLAHAALSLIVQGSSLENYQ